MAKAFMDVPSIEGAESARRIKQALMILEGIQRVDVNVPARKVLLTYDESAIRIEAVSEALAEIGFAVEETTTGP